MFWIEQNAIIWVKLNISTKFTSTLLLCLNYNFQQSFKNILYLYYIFNEILKRK